MSTFFSRSTGKKYIMAISGLALIGFLLMHLLGNLQIFLGQEKMNAYSEFLKGTGELLWKARFGLLAMVIAHIVTAIQLTLENRAARPQAYQQKEFVKASYASRTMAVSGFIVLAYIVYHLMHFTFLWVHPQYSHLIDAKGRHDVYSMVVLSFQQPLIAAAYIVAMFLLATHLSHGLSSLFRSLGLAEGTCRKTLETWAPRFAWLIFLGYAAIPAAVLAGLVKLPAGVGQ